ncbi:MOSC domain-containing protein YiiM [Roseivirga ehrenbergii]|uniref:Molybdenum cofactor sulfurase n=1 Tax=Roseivirga ehrenbergii (strain DSM 102268 / JCM 13514 / KCTC 12282 / NCIMB 14502 / KMM 6017) TaxID=279360 RepID=A0A150XTA1_ROSEK|nr:MOSC domain-containing protein [Roseivirga ehrenbergii]KYG81957.1 molybdenum cofactor sulfurase [Roseivirga ehrenbergii]TCL01775.1 MOSC domain-containing protein YiiM [Roseivirga ehrenbergii]
MKLSLEQKSIPYLTNQFAQVGKVVFISIRPQRGELPQTVQEVYAIEGIGLEGDHYASKGGKRQVTLIQAEHIKAVASMIGQAEVDPLLLRRNIVVEGINLQALKGKKFRIGNTVLEHTGDCHPCSRMEENLGNGGYNAMRGHGGITARILSSGRISLDDELSPMEQPQEFPSPTLHSATDQDLQP